MSGMIAPVAHATAENERPAARHPAKEKRLQVAQVKQEIAEGATPPTPADILGLQNYLGRFPQVEMELIHTFAPGLYIRTLRIPKDTIVVGKEHLFDNVFMLTKGKFRLYTVDGVQIVEAPYQVIAKPGKKVVYTLEDCEVSNVQITDLTDPVAIEAHFIKAEQEAISQPNLLGEA